MGSNRYGESQAAGIAERRRRRHRRPRHASSAARSSQSNVDIAQEFTQMILAQRGYQANSRSITVADEILVETLKLKR